MSLINIDPVTSDVASRVLSEIREDIAAHRTEGIECPACFSFVKVYPRQVGSLTARTLIFAYREYRTEWFHLPTLLKNHRLDNSDQAKARYWGLIEPREGERDDGGKWNGWWRLTDKGVGYVLGHERVPKYAHIYQTHLLEMDGPMETIRQALGKKFRYAELMGWE